MEQPMSPRLARLEALRRESDEDLMTQLQSGSEEAFELLVRRHSRSVRSYLFRFVGNVEIAEDLTQDTFLRVFKSRQSYRRIAKFTTWLFTIAGNLARSEYRRRNRAQLSSIQLVSQENGEYVMDVEDDAPGLDIDLDIAMQYDRAQRALDDVPESFREVVVLRDVQDLSYEEIGSITGLPMGTVKSRIHRGRTLLNTLLYEAVPA